MWVLHDLLEYTCWLLAHVRQGQSHLQKLLKSKTTPTFWTSTDLQNIPKNFSPSVQTYRLLLFCGCIFSTYKIGRWDGPNPKSRRGFWSCVLGWNILAPTFFERLTQMQSNIPMWQFKPNLDQWSIYSLSPQGSGYKMLLKIYTVFETNIRYIIFTTKKTRHSKTLHIQPG